MNYTILVTYCTMLTKYGLAKNVDFYGIEEDNRTASMNFDIKSGKAHTTFLPKEFVDFFLTYKK